jgi:hypothetical protein
VELSAKRHFPGSALFAHHVNACAEFAHPDQRAGLLAGFYVECYLAFRPPTVAAGLAVPRIGLATTAYVYGVSVILPALASMIVSLFDNEEERKPRSRA